MRGYFKNLEVWKKSVSLAKSIYQITKDFPKEELFGITSQLRRAVISVSTNIAEWNQRSSNKEYAHFLKPGRLQDCWKIVNLVQDLMIENGYSK